jgi:hypothetical protein
VGKWHFERVKTRLKHVSSSFTSDRWQSSQKQMVEDQLPTRADVPVPDDTSGSERPLSSFRTCPMECTAAPGARRSAQRPCTARNRSGKVSTPFDPESETGFCPGVPNRGSCPGVPWRFWRSANFQVRPLERWIGCNTPLRIVAVSNFTVPTFFVSRCRRICRQNIPTPAHRCPSVRSPSSRWTIGTPSTNKRTQRRVLDHFVFSAAFSIFLTFAVVQERIAAD